MISSLELEKIEDDAIIGSGVYGECKIKTYKRLGINVVEKQLKGGDIDMLYREAQYIQMFAHRCIPHLFGVKLDAKPLALVMEFLGEANKSVTIHKLLFSHHHKIMKSNLCMKDWFFICYDIVDALNFIHNKGYLHCDVKTDNVIIFQKKGYLIDFGKVNAIASSSAKKYERHYDHIAPEVLDGNPPTPASDVFSLGKIFVKIGRETETLVLNELGSKATSPDPKHRPSLSHMLATLTL